MSKPNGGALAGLKILDLTTMLSGPFCTMMLADQGAEVIKVEPPGGDGTRALGPFMSDDQLRNFGGYFQSVNRNKKSIVLDLKLEADRKSLRTLVREVDVLVENYRSGVMERFGLSYEHLSELNPKLVYACLRGFGDRRTGKSPYETWPSYDVVAQAMGGIMAITGEVGHPTKVGPGVGDIVPALMLSYGILAALRHAHLTGEGQLVDVGMYDAVLAMCERLAYQHSYTGLVPGPEGNGHPLLCPFGLFEAADGWVSIAGHTDRFWDGLTKAMEREDLRTNPRYATNAARVANKIEVQNEITEWTKLRTKSELVTMLGNVVPFGPVNTIEEIFADQHTTARNLLVEVEQPGSRVKPKIVNTAVHLSRTPGGIFSRAPLLDEHKSEIMSRISGAS